jgi:hypothetical protein
MVLSALQQAALPAGGEEPSLDRLKRDPECTTDPYSGNRLLMKQAPSGWIVYSVGRDGKDDGGAIGAPYKDIGAGLPPP